MTEGERRHNGFYEGRFLDELQKSITDVGRKVECVDTKVEKVSTGLRELKQELSAAQARSYETALEMIPRLNLVRFQPEEQAALREMVASHLASGILEQAAEKRLTLTQTKHGRLVLWLGITGGALAILAILGNFVLAAYNAFYGVAHPVGGQ